MAKKPQSKWLVKSLELECVGMRHRTSISTRRFVAAYVAEAGMQITFKREPDNVHDENAIAVYGGGAKGDNPYYKLKLGYIPRKTAAVLAPALDKGRAEFGVSLMTDVDVDNGTADLQVKLRVRRNLKISLDKM
jgi:HIRAN domain